jgi:hypothetical protein
VAPADNLLVLEYHLDPQLAVVLDDGVESVASLLQLQEFLGELFGEFAVVAAAGPLPGRVLGFAVVAAAAAGEGAFRTRPSHGEHHRRGGHRVHQGCLAVDLLQEEPALRTVPLIELELGLTVRDGQVPGVEQDLRKASSFPTYLALVLETAQPLARLLVGWGEVVGVGKNQRCEGFLSLGFQRSRPGRYVNLCLDRLRRIWWKRK